MTTKSTRIAKKAAKTGMWALSDIIFIILKTMGTVVLIAVTTAVLFSCVFLIYVRENLTTGLDLNPASFSMSLSSSIYCIDPVTGRERELVTLQSEETRRWVDFEDVPVNLINALIAIEDHRFYQHDGVDWYRTTGAFLNMFLSMRDTFGGSTITQQLIKNLTDEDDVTVQRKLMEIFRALEFERQYEKTEILELYLNLVYFGHGCYGIGAASNYYFGKEVSDLTLPESAAIIGITNNPSMYSPYADRAKNKERQEDILLRMYELGYITSEREFRSAVNTRLNFERGEDSIVEQVTYTWFEETVIMDVVSDLMIRQGVSEQVARLMLFTSGWKIMATIDLNMQETVDELYTNVDQLPNVTGSSQQLQTSIVIADPHTGEIKALSGGVGEKTRNMILNRATMTQRPPGSSLKPLSAYAPAMNMGVLTPETIYEDSANVRLNGTTWMPRNADWGHSGFISVRNAVRLSLNTIPAVVVDQIGTEASYLFLKDALGFNLHPADQDYAPLAAGQLTNGITVREMASGFTIFPNAGERMALRSYSVIYDANGAVYLDNRASGNRAISEESAYWMTDMLYGAVQYGTGSEANLGAMPTAGKTGTSSDSKDRWFVGFTPYYVAAVWTGYDMPATMRVSGNPAAQIWKRIMAPIHESLEPRAFYPDGGDYHLPQVPGISPIAYTVRYLDSTGAVISEENGSAIAGREVSAAAPEIEGYTLISAQTATMTVSADPSRNVITFIYRPDEPVETTPPENTESPSPTTGTEPPVSSELPIDPGETPIVSLPPDPGATPEPSLPPPPSTSPPTTPPPSSPPPQPTPSDAVPSDTG